MSSEHGNRVLVTGLASELAGRLVTRLEDDDRIAHIVGIDHREPTREFTRTEVIRADLRNPLLARTMATHRIDTIVHLSLLSGPGAAGGRSKMKELNVIGTMQLLGAAQQALGVRKIVMRSTTAVYGSSYASPALLRETSAPAGHQRSGYAKDAVEVESYGRAFGRRRLDVALSILRFANFVAPDAQTSLGRLLSLPAVPTVLGYDPRLQMCHLDDAIEVLARSVVEDHPGIYNVAGPGTVYLSQAIRRMGRVAIPVLAPVGKVVAAVLQRTGVVDFSPEQLQLLLYGRVGDITRLRTEFGYEPEFSTTEALQAFIEGHQLSGPVDAKTARGLERRLAMALTRPTPSGGAQ